MTSQSRSTLSLSPWTTGTIKGRRAIHKRINIHKGDTNYQGKNTTHEWEKKAEKGTREPHINSRC